MTNAHQEATDSLTPAPSQCSLDAFLAAYGDVFEHSPWIAEQAWHQGLDIPHDDPAVLAQTMSDVLRAAPRERQIEVIRAHPDLAGKAALADELTDASKSEQAGAGLDQCSIEELARFESLNGAYLEKFGFPFVIAVKGLDRHDILAAFETRLNNTPDEERETAIEQIACIARFRLIAKSEA
ncbi:2-oxo-4-hydroxy-4-carboxy-5-ureidoimidazoline decarboxylase [Halomonas sp. PAMB 3264]|uniref:2-oxo-4-hydroxy-4-carboxy-5-ureidoimidazoline decarboxylase n=1 Tax=Halomonas sp. PAMB 3264 TaxID=3075222 RepID=UPI00289C8302|nr:2-oxo-4-hydroxy-4-carboxy-5-ureidoimidazoline decarboxylase [Halomonas sp. PAMB 3264]WNL41650.1 2-oxo-4-hydroxy-4-carboxy-5-ureidoimidazoline decarboxylase [Halomonas sp. PAMB 3264]